MKYLLLMYGKEDAWTPEEHEVALQESIDICFQMHEKGQYIHAAPLHPVSDATCVRVQDDKVLISDGPFVETKEQLGGFFLIDVDSLDEAVAIASRLPGTTRGTTEIRPVVEIPNLPGN